MRTLPELERHLSRCIARGKGARLEAADLDRLVECGAYAVLAGAAAEELKRLAVARSKEREEAARPAARPETSIKAVEALDRARRLTKPPG